METSPIRSPGLRQLIHRAKTTLAQVELALATGDSPVERPSRNVPVAASLPAMPSARNSVAVEESPILDMSGRGLMDSDFEHHLVAACNRPSGASRLRELHAEGNRLTDRSAVLLGAFVTHSALADLQVVDISRNQVSDQGISVLLEALKDLPRVSSVMLTRDAVIARSDAGQTRLTIWVRPAAVFDASGSRATQVPPAREASSISDVTDRTPAAAVVQVPESVKSVAPEGPEAARAGILCSTQRLTIASFAPAAPPQMPVLTKPVPQWAGLRAGSADVFALSIPSESWRASPAEAEPNRVPMAAILPIEAAIPPREFPHEADLTVMVTSAAGNVECQVAPSVAESDHPGDSLIPATACVDMNSSFEPPRSDNIAEPHDALARGDVEEDGTTEPSMSPPAPSESFVARGLARQLIDNEVSHDEGLSEAEALSPGRADSFPDDFATAPRDVMEVCMTPAA